MAVSTVAFAALITEIDDYVIGRYSLRTELRLAIFLVITVVDSLLIHVYLIFRMFAWKSGGDREQ